MYAHVHKILINLYINLPLLFPSGDTGKVLMASDVPWFQPMVFQL